MRRGAFLGTGAALAAVPRTAAAAEESYVLETPTGSIYGTLTLPSRSRPPVVLIVAGSGPTDRDGNSGGAVHAASYRLLAEALAAAGIACLRYDKRGIGRSAAAGPNEAALRFDDFVADATGWLAKLRGDGRFGKRGVAGHSEGSLIGMLAARNGADAFVSLAGPGFPAADVLRRQMAPQLERSTQLAAAVNRIVDELVAGHNVSDVPPALLPLFHAAVQPYLISWFRFDPRAEIAKLTVPCAIVQGTNDVQITVDDARALAAAQPRAKLVIVDGMTHVLKDAPPMPAAQQLQTVYQDPTVPIDRTVVTTIAEALR